MSKIQKRLLWNRETQEKGSFLSNIDLENGSLLCSPCKIGDFKWSLNFMR